METKRKHVPTWLYKLGGRLDKQYEEIVSALSDINAFNAGKKRDKALELIAAWLPDVEKFSKEISKQSAYINCLLYTSPSPRDPKTSRMPSSA